MLDRSDSFAAQGGPLFSEIKAAMYDNKNRPLMSDYIFGLGGRDIGTAEIETVYNELLDNVKNGKIKNEVNYLGVRE